MLSNNTVQGVEYFATRDQHRLEKVINLLKGLPNSTPGVNTGIESLNDVIQDLTAIAIQIRIDYKEGN